MTADMELPGSPFSHPEERLPCFNNSADDQALLQGMLDCLGNGQDSASSPDHIARLFGRSSFPQHFDRLVMVLYAPGHPRIMVSRPGQSFAAVFERLLQHPRRDQLVSESCRIQLDFIAAPPEPVDLYAIGMQRVGDRHFEVGVDGLLYRGPDGKAHLFLPGDAYVRSVMTMGQLRERLHKIHGEAYVRQARFFRFRSKSYLSAKGSWLALFRGYPAVGALTRGKLEQALDLAVNHIRHTQDEQGKFLYYYDAALDSRLDHEHPGRNPDRNPYYNILRHCGGGLTCLYFEKWAQSGQTLENTRRAIEYLIPTSFRTTSYGGREGAYVYSERKAKLGGSGIALYLLADYQMQSGDGRYRGWADKLAWHLINQITASGEFIYYSIYLDREISEAENQNYFSFYYPGEAVCGLAKYLHLVGAEGREAYFEKLRKALQFLLVERPLARADQYTAIPSDSWLMMGIMELWDFPEMRNAAYADFVFMDARQMVDHMYKVSDAPYPDYAGAFYYDYGDYPYADGARCEGLLGAYALAGKMGDGEKMRALWPALRLAAWSLMHLVNTEDAIYSAPNPAIALGGIRFKYTRQWFRIDTIQHVASFFAKLLAFWDAAESSVAMLAEGDAGPRVRELQEALLRHGHYLGPIDGVYSGETTAAVKRMQVVIGLAATGVADSTTLIALRNASRNLMSLMDPDRIAEVVGGEWGGAPPAKRIDCVSLLPTRLPRMELIPVARRDALQDYFADPHHRHILCDGQLDAIPAHHSVLRVDRTIRGLARLARHARSQLSGRVIAITGSSGKTTTKEMLRTILSRQGITHASGGSANSTSAICAGLVNAPLAAEWLIFESGLGAAGSSIRAHSELLRPDVAVVTSVDQAHAEGYVSLEEIARRKMDIAAHMNTGGTLFVDADSELHPLFMDTAREFRVRHVHGFGVSRAAAIRVLGHQVSLAGTSVELQVHGSRHTAMLPMIGAHWAKLLAAVAGTCAALQLNLDQSLAGLAQMVIPAGRGRIVRIAKAGGDLIAFDSHYNANPGSMAADIRAYQAVAELHPELRRMAIVGEYKELGDFAIEAHRALGGLLLEAGFERIFLIGSNHAETRRALLDSRVEVYASVDEALPSISRQAVAGCFLFIKGSNSNNLVKVMTGLQP